MNQEAIKPCPFCGCSATRLKAIGSNYRICCCGCETRSGFAESKKEAIDRWNRREDKQCSELAAENAGLKAFGDKLSEMHNDLNGEGTGIHGRAEVACQQVALEAAMEEFDAIQTPSTDAFLAEVRAQGVELAIGHIEQTISPNHETILNEFAAKLRQEAAQ